MAKTLPTLTNIIGDVKRVAEADICYNLKQSNGQQCEIEVRGLNKAKLYHEILTMAGWNCTLKESFQDYYIIIILPIDNQTIKQDSNNKRGIFTPCDIYKLRMESVHNQVSKLMNTIVFQEDLIFNKRATMTFVYTNEAYIAYDLLSSAGWFVAKNLSSQQCVTLFTTAHDLQLYTLSGSIQTETNLPPQLTHMICNY